MASNWTPTGVGRRIAHYRTQRGMTQTVLAGLLGRSVSWVRQVEQGALHVDKLSVIIDAADILRCRVEDLIGLRMAALCADRSVALAREADDPVTLALSAWSVTGVLNADGHPDEGEHVATEAIRILGRALDDGPPRLLGLYGQLHLVRAISQARAGLDGPAWGSWDEADRIARRLGPDWVDPVTCFCAGNVAAHSVAIPAELGQARRAVEASERVDVSGMPSVERRSRYYLDVARGYVGQRDDVAAVHMLLRAESESPEELLYSGVVAELLRELLVRNNAAVRDDLRALATRVGMAA